MDGEGRGRAEPEGIARARALLAAGLLALSGCATTHRTAADEDLEAAALAELLRARPIEMATHTVLVRLAFATSVDLDLYVTGPLEEAVYFANTPSRIGGRLLGDVRCDAPAPRIETVVYPSAPAGRYRVGVDFPERCDGGRGDAAFAVEVLADGQRHERQGRVGLRVFEPVVLEITTGRAAGRAAEPND